MDLYTRSERGGKIWRRRIGSNGAWSVEDGIELLLTGFVQMVKPQQVVEIGTYEGSSARAICEGRRANGSGRLVTIDIKDYGQAKNLQEFADIVEVVISPHKPMNECDVVFVDGDHSLEGATADFKYADAVLRRGGYILAHDVITHAKAAWDAAVSLYRERYDTLVIESFDGIGVLRKR